MSQLNSSRLFTALLMSGRLNSSHLISSHLSLSQLFQDFLTVSQLFSALRSSCLLISSLLFSHFFNSSHTILADLSLSQLFSACLSSSQLTLRSFQLFSLWFKTCSRPDPSAKATKSQMLKPFKTKFKRNMKSAKISKSSSNAIFKQ